MPGKFKTVTDYHDNRFCQISESHCGPAVIQMMLANLGVEVTQDEIARAGDIGDRIEVHGSRIDQLAKAVKTLSPQTRFYYKDHATIDELVKVVNEYEYPVGVEWQGLFEGEPESEETQAAEAPLLPDSESEDEDYGHYSLVIRAHTGRRVLIIADPYKDYIAQDRIFTFREFDSRWFDYNEVPVEGKKRPKLVKDDHLMFVIVPDEETFPIEMGMKTF